MEIELVLNNQKIRILLVAGVIGLVTGYSLDHVTPIIKRISTTSFVLASGGWTVLALCFSYWIIEVRQLRKWARIFVIVGMNPLFIYLFAHVGGSGLINKIFTPFTMGLFSWTGDLPAKIITGLITWAFLWYLCYWLYRRKIFIKI